jgi:putative ABC transport system substrate-binding protein
MIQRRTFITLLGGAAAWPLAAAAQRPIMPVIGYLSNRTADSDASMLISLRRGLGDVGYIEGRNVAIECRFTGGRYGHLSGQLADLTQRKVGVIVLTGGSSSSKIRCSKSAPRRSRSSSALATIRSAWAS